MFYKFGLNYVVFGGVEFCVLADFLSFVERGVLTYSSCNCGFVFISHFSSVFVFVPLRMHLG